MGSDGSPKSELLLAKVTLQIETSKQTIEAKGGFHAVASGLGYSLK